MPIMTYIESVNATANQRPLAPASREVIEHGLSLRYSDTLKQATVEASRTLELSTLSPEDQKLFRSRVFGGLATKFALGSHYADTPDLQAISPDDQAKELEQLANTYAERAIDHIDTGADLQTLLTPGADTDILPDISNKLVRSWVYTSRRAATGPIQHLRNASAYINITPGTFPPQPYFVPPMGDNDVNLVQAFGRDSVTDSELVSIRDERQKLGNDDAMLAHLDTIEFKPGPSNIALADKVAYLLVSDKPVEQVMQWEVTYAFYQKHPSLYSRFRNYIHTVWPHSGFYPTYEVKEDSVAVMDKIGLYNPLELAHGDMMSRTVGILIKLGTQPDPIAADIPFDVDSTQPHVRSANSFMVREALARVEHVLRNRVKF